MLPVELWQLTFEFVDAGSTWKAILFTSKEFFSTAMRVNPSPDTLCNAQCGRSSLLCERCSHKTPDKFTNHLMTLLKLYPRYKWEWKYIAKNPGISARQLEYLLEILPPIPAIRGPDRARNGLRAAIEKKLISEASNKYCPRLPEYASVSIEQMIDAFRQNKSINGVFRSLDDISNTRGFSTHYLADNIDLDWNIETRVMYGTLEMLSIMLEDPTINFKNDCRGFRYENDLCRLISLNQNITCQFISSHPEVDWQDYPLSYSMSMNEIIKYDSAMYNVVSRRRDIRWHDIVATENKWWNFGDISQYLTR